MCIKDIEKRILVVSLSQTSEMESRNLIGEDVIEDMPAIPSTSTQTPGLDLESQLKMLKQEREKGLRNLAIIESMKEEGEIHVANLNLNLIPAINNQRKANISLDCAVKKVVRFRRPLREIRQIISSNRLESEWPEEITTGPQPTTCPSKPTVAQEVKSTIA